MAAYKIRLGALKQEIQEFSIITFSYPIALWFLEKGAPNLFFLAPLVEPSGDLQNFKSDVVPATLDVDCTAVGSAFQHSCPGSRYVDGH